jgi:SAM-dependent methyltransferase
MDEEPSDRESAAQRATNDNRDVVRQRFGRAAEGYVESATHRAPDELDTIVRFAEPQLTDVALDIATGGGHTALALAPHVARVIATDITGEMLEAARTHVGGSGASNVEYRLADAEVLPFADASFEIVTCRIAAHHFPHPRSFVSEAARVLRTGGRLVLQDQVVPADPDAARVVNEFEALRDPSHAQALSEPEWLALLSGAGLEIGEVEHVLKPHGFVGWCSLQSCAPATVERLVDLLAGASESVRAWMDPHDWGTPEATFANRQAIIQARR